MALLASSHHPVSLTTWKFSGNRASGILKCPPVPITNFEHFYCRNLSAVADCACKNTNHVTLTKFDIPLLILGDCNHLTLDISNDGITTLILYRIDRLAIRALPSSLNVLRILQSRLAPIPAVVLHGLDLSLILCHQCYMEAIHKDAFSNMRVRKLFFNETMIHSVADDAFLTNFVDELTLMHSHIQHAGNLLSQVKNVRIINSTTRERVDRQKMTSEQLQLDECAITDHVYSPNSLQTKEDCESAMIPRRNSATCPCPLLLFTLLTAYLTTFISQLL
jgi:hypothetical protein